jgi:hypothetical protein
MKLKTIVDLHLNRERLDVLISVVIPLVLMAVSGWANGWTFAGGVIDWASFNTYFGLFRGFFLEALIFAMFLLVRILILKTDRHHWYNCVVALLPFSIGLIAMIVSAGLNIGWSNRSGEMQTLVSTVNAFLPPVFMTVFKMGIGLLFPIGVAAFALLDVGHLVDEMLEKSAHMNHRVMKVENAERHQELIRKKQQESLKEVEEQYAQMVRADTQNMVDRVKANDWSFGLNDPAQSSQKQSSVTRITPAQSPLLPSAPAFPQLGGPAITGQFTAPPTLSSGNTQNIQFPPIQPYPQMPPLPQKP